MLNSQQQIAVDTIDGPLLINAGAGSGKTHTITERVVSMIHERHIDPRSIFCVTFTNKAAKEMRGRIAVKLGLNPDGLNPFREHRLPMVGTFHSTASFFLRMFIDRVGYGKDFVIYDSDDCLRVVKDIMKKQNIDDKEFNPRGVHGMISQTKGKGMTPSDFSATVDSYYASVVLEIYKEYAGRLKADNALDFDDLLLLFRQVLDLPEVLEYFHNRFSYFMVDEYQDTNLLQYEIVRILASKTKNLCVVGDDWQGIYSWRGADIENILSFKKDYPNAMVINLEENYRSTQIIIDAANAVIKNNTNQMKKTLFTSNPVGEKIVILEGIDEKHEADLITNVIRDSEAGSYSEFAILYRTNGQSRLLEESLIRKNIPYRVFGGVKFYERKEIKDILAYIRIIFNPLDSMSLKRIINVPGRKIGEKSLENFLEILNREHISIAEMSENEFLLNAITGIGAKGIQGFSFLYKGLREISKTASVAELMDNIIKRTGYEAYLKAEYTEEEFDGKMENLDEFLNMASRYDGLIYPENIASFLEDIALITDQDRDQEDKQKTDTGFVSLMTIHLSKGLEYPTIFIAGAEEGIFPHSRSLVDSSQLEEERRLMYVAITRAKTELYISRAHERYTFGNYSANPKSRFIKEIPAEYLEVESNRGSAQSIFGNGGSGFSSFGNMFNNSEGSSSPAFSNGNKGPSSMNSFVKTGIKPKNSAASFSTGSRVKHAQYGVGTIVTIDGAIASIAFSGLGIKKMNVEIAPIEKV
ncbi:UvrD-helicase domain-containing protein [Candidatus Gracilibacteria bacterium]|nr:UvrD-helicase domain-containing protein [Candidatus Gracilibacteria bacterium]